VIYVQPTLDEVKTGIMRAVESPRPPRAVHRSWNQAGQVLARALCEARGPWRSLSVSSTLLDEPVR